MTTEARSCTRSPSNEDYNMKINYANVHEDKRGRRSKELINTFLTYFLTNFEAMVEKTTVKAG